MTNHGPSPASPERILGKAAETRRAWQREPRRWEYLGYLGWAVVVFVIYQFVPFQFL